jgi:hypothetical protein
MDTPKQTVMYELCEGLDPITEASNITVVIMAMITTTAVVTTGSSSSSSSNFKHCNKLIELLLQILML